MAAPRHLRTGVARLSVENLEDRITPAAGDLDTTFGMSGIASIPFPNVGNTSGAIAQDAAVQADGRIILVGSAGTQALIAGNQDFGVARLNVSGSLDTSFGSGGLVRLGIGPTGFLGSGSTEIGQTVTLQSDGKILVGGSTATAGGIIWAVTRLNTDGTLDTSFGTGGFVTFPFNTPGTGVTDIAVQPDGRIVLSGNSGSLSGFPVARLNQNGTFDTSFGGTGRVFVTVPGGSGNVAGANPSSLDLQPDGRIVVAGTLATFGGDFAAARLNTNGALDATFGTGGTMTVGLRTPGALGLLNPFNGTVGDVTLQSDGKIVIVGGGSISGTGVTGNGDFTIVRLTTTGTLDTTFDTDGKAFVAFDLGGGNNDLATGVAVQPDGRIVVGGRAETNSPPFSLQAINFFAAARLNTDGSLDTSFAPTVGGKARYPVNSVSVSGIPNPIGANATIFVSGGKILLAGGDTSQMVAIQLTNDVTFNPLPPGGGGGGGGVGIGIAGSFLSTGADGGRVFGYGLGTDGRYDTNRVVKPDLSNVFPGFSGVVRSAMGDVNGDTIPDFVVVSGPGTPTRFAVINGNLSGFLIPPSFPFRGSESFDGGAFVSVGDLDGDGRADVVITPDQGGGPRVVVFSLPTTGFTVRADFFGIDDAGFRGGARTAIGDVNGDGRADLAVAAGSGGGPRVAVLNGQTLFTTRAKLVGDFFAFDNVLRDGVYVAIGDVNGDGFGDLVFGAGDGGAPRVLVVSGQQAISTGVAALRTPLANFFVAGNTTARGGVRVAVKNVDGDGRADLVTGSGAGQPSLVRVYLGANVSGREPTVFQDLDPFGTVLPSGIFVG